MEFSNIIVQNVVIGRKEWLQYALLYTQFQVQFYFCYTVTYLSDVRHVKCCTATVLFVSSDHV